MIERIIAFSKSSASETVRKKRILTAFLFVLVVLLMVFLLPWDEIWRVLKPLNYQSWLPVCWLLSCALFHRNDLSSHCTEPGY